MDRPRTTAPAWHAAVTLGAGLVASAGASLALAAGYAADLNTGDELGHPYDFAGSLFVLGGIAYVAALFWRWRLGEIDVARWIVWSVVASVALFVLLSLSLNETMSY
ncbi:MULTISPECIES: hypothetical protein [unclassified Isoptericola]|uniref:hypothetical protein n=1 Tax=Isoptericola sp. NPDC057191 TaxID=3346041 RepID=UPI0036315520